MGKPLCQPGASHNFDLFGQSSDHLAKYPDIVIRVPTCYQ